MAREMRSSPSELFRVVVLYEHTERKGPPIKQVWGPYSRRSDAARRGEEEALSLGLAGFHANVRVPIQTTGPIEWKESVEK